MWFVSSGCSITKLEATGIVCWFAHCHFRVRSCCAKLWPSVSEYLKMETESHQIVSLSKGREASKRGQQQSFRDFPSCWIVLAYKTPMRPEASSSDSMGCKWPNGHYSCWRDKHWQWRKLELCNSKHNLKRLAEHLCCRDAWCCRQKNVSLGSQAPHVVADINFSQPGNIPEVPQ